MLVCRRVGTIRVPNAGLLVRVRFALLLPPTQPIRLSPASWPPLSPCPLASFTSPLAVAVPLNLLYPPICQTLPSYLLHGRLHRLVLALGRLHLALGRVDAVLQRLDVGSLLGQLGVDLRSNVHTCMSTQGALTSAVFLDSCVLLNGSGYHKSNTRTFLLSC